MSRYSDYDDYEGEPEQILAQGRWEHNARVALKGKRGRQALREFHRFIARLRYLGKDLPAVAHEHRDAAGLFPLITAQEDRRSQTLGHQVGG